MNTRERVEDIRREHVRRCEEIGVAEANRELYEAFAAAEAEHAAEEDRLLEIRRVLERAGSR